MTQSLFLKALHKERDNLFLWFPVGLGCGIVIYFSLPVEPSFQLIGLMITLQVGLAVKIFKDAAHKTHILEWSILTCILGFTASFYRTHALSTFMLERPIYGHTFEGKVAALESPPISSPKHFRLLLDNLKATPSLLRTIPCKVRLTLHEVPENLSPGDFIQIRANLFPVPLAPSPLSLDMRRHAFFKGIGANGMVLKVQNVSKLSQTSWQFRITRLRHHMTQTFLKELPAPLGSIASSLITGDTSALPATVRKEFACSGLAHILAISGLHLSIIAGFSFFLFQRLTSFVPRIALSFSGHKMAALWAIITTFLYLELSGEGIPAQRSFVMTSFVMGAIILNRQAISLRTIAWSATFILLCSPEALLTASFQLSFSAVLALVVSYQEMRKLPFITWFQRSPSIFRRILLSLFSSSFSSLIASFATTPFAIVFFHQATAQSIISNLCAIPLVSFIVMPLAVLASLSIFLGGSLSIFSCLGLSLKVLLWIAEEMSTWPGASFSIPVGQTWGIACFALGGIWLCCCCTFLRWIGIIPMLGGIIGILTPSIPDLWIDGERKIIGFFDQKEHILWVSSQKQGVFAQKIWSDLTAARAIKEFSQENFIFLTPFEDTLNTLFPFWKQRLFKEKILSPLKELTSYTKTGACAIWRDPNFKKLKIQWGNRSVRPWTSHPYQLALKKGQRKKSQTYLSKTPYSPNKT